MSADIERGCLAFNNAESLYSFHRANIHERRRAATFARLFPLLLFLLVTFLAALGFVLSTRLLLSICAVLNASLCLGMSCRGILCLLGVRKMALELQSEVVELHEDGIQHLIVIANYKEDLQMLSQTLTSLAQAHGAHSFHVVLAMEAREGPAGLEKAAQLSRGFSKYFSTLRSTSHPSNLREEHADGSWDPEVPGKASNVKWAVREAHRELLKESVDPASVILTVADADVVFHPRYFSHLTRDFGAVRQHGGGWHEWTIWQAPQLPFRNYYASPACSRVWAYVASIWECGGVAGLSFGSEHFAFSTYSLPLLLAVEAEAHEGDVIAEDHHCYIRCFFYSAVKEAALAQGGQEIPTWRGLARAHLRPIFLPVKSTSVVSDKGVWQTWIDRWFQAKRHAQGVAELSFFVLAVWDALRQLPTALWSASFALSVTRMAGTLMFIHMIPPCHFVAMGSLLLYWMANRHIDICSPAENARDFALCSAAGVWNPAWPAIPITALIIAASVAMVSTVYLQPLERGHYRSSLWTLEAGGLPTTCGSSLMTLTGLVLWDCLVCTGLLVLPYGIVTEILAFWNVAFRGNRFDYVTAAKAMASSELPEVQTRPLLRSAA